MSHEGKKVRSIVGCAPHTKEAPPEAVCGAHPTTSDFFFRFHLLFFVLGFVYLWLVVEPHLIYHGFGTILPDAPLFATGWPFLSDAFGRPGGLVVYASGFLSQSYYYSWLGAAIIVLTGFGLADLTRRHLRTAGLAHAWVPATVPALALFLIYSHYRHPLPAGLAVLLGLFLSLGFAKSPWRQPLVRSAAGCLLAAVGFWLGGGGTLLVFALLTVAHELLVLRDWRTIALALPVGSIIVWLLAEFVFLLPTRAALLIHMPFAPSLAAGLGPFLKVLMFLLYAFVPVAVLLVFTGKSMFGGRGKKQTARSGKPRGKQKHAATGPRRFPRAILQKPVLPAIPIVLMALGLYLTYDELRKPYVRSNCYAHRRQWDKIIALNSRLPKGRTNVFVNHDFLRALYHTGRLPYDMFHCPLIPEAILLTHEKRESDLTQWKLCDIFLELGHVNLAQKLASELVATKDHLGIALEKLGWIGLIKRNPGTAQVYLEALKKDPIHRARAQSLLRGLEDCFTPEQTAYLDRIRSFIHSETAGVTGREPVDETLAALLRHNPRNRMAFEYLMACYLLTGRVDGIVQNVERLKDLGYERIPTLYEEAILIYNETAQPPAGLHGYSLSPQTRQRYEAFVQILSLMQTPNRQAAFQRLIREFGTSYFFYYAFGRVGAA